MTSFASKLAHRLIGVGVLLVLTACRSIPEIHSYDFAPYPEHAPSSSSSLPRIGVLTFEVDPPLDQDQLMYRVGNEVGFYRTHRWAAPLGELVALETARRLTERSSHARFEPVSSNRSYELSIRGRIHHFEEVDLASGQLARISLELELLSAGGVLWSKRLESESEVRTEQVSVIVDLFRRDLVALLHTASGEIEKILSLTRVSTDR